MLLDSVLDENAIISEESVVDATDALTECLVGVEEAYGDMMLEQAKAEFKQYVNEGSIEPLNEGVVESIKNFFKKLWNFIKKYWNKLKNWVTGLNKNAYQYYQVNKEKIKNGMTSANTRFYGYNGLKTTKNISELEDRISKAVAAAAKKELGAVALAKGADENGADNTKKENADNVIKKTLHSVKTEIVGNTNSVEENFVSILKDDIRGGSKETKITYSLDELQSVVGNETAVKRLALSIKTQEAETKNLENKAYGISHAQNENDRSGRAVNYYTQLAKLLTTACNAASSMIPEVVKQADRFQHMAANGKSDDERKNEDADMSVDDAKAYLESIGLA